MLARCRPYQQYVSLAAPDRKPMKRPAGRWEIIGSASTRACVCLAAVDPRCGSRSYPGSIISMPEKYAALLQDAGATFVEVKGYMYLGYSRNRLARENMPEHDQVQVCGKNCRCMRL